MMGRCSPWRASTEYRAVSWEAPYERKRRVQRESKDRPRRRKLPAEGQRRDRRRRATETAGHSAFRRLKEVEYPGGILPFRKARAGFSRRAKQSNRGRRPFLHGSRPQKERSVVSQRGHNHPKNIGVRKGKCAAGHPLDGRAG